MVKSQVRLTKDVTPEHYQIMLKPDLTGFIFTGEETITLNLLKPTKQITLHSSEIEIESAELIQDKKDNWAGKISYNEQAETATLSFSKTIPKGKGKLKLIFRGFLNDKMRGFYRSKFTHLGREKHLATTQFESTDARKAFPCFDEPIHKAIFEVSLMAPPNTIAVSNTIESTVREHQSGYRVFEFAPTPRMSTYLLAFIIGELEFIEGKTREGVKVRVFTTPGKKDQAKFALEVATKTLSFFNAYFGIDYPLPVLDLIAIPDFSAGAMENWGAITYRESALLIDEEHSSSANKQLVAIVIAHELAHMWFGDLVTMQWWTHLWLNEGFASYIEYLAVSELFPEWDIWTQFVYLDHNTALKLDGLKNTHPVEVEVDHPDEISEIFDKVSYSKGASIIRMLAEYLGEKVFQKGLQYYLKKHKYSNASTKDLWRSFEVVSKKPIGKIMANWTAKPGYPVIKLSEGRKKLELSQSRFFSSIHSQKQTRDNTLWSIPVNIQTIGKTEQLLMNKKSISINKPKTDSFIKLNANETGFFRVNYPPKYLELLKVAIEAGELGVLDRLGIVRDVFDLCEAGQLPVNQALDLALSYIGETDYTVWSVLASKLGQIANLISEEKFYGNFQTFCRKIFLQAATNIGWEKQPGEKHTDALLRSLLLYNLGSNNHGPTIEKARELFEYAVSGKKKLEADLRSVVYNLVAENGGSRQHFQLKEMYIKEPLQQEKDRLGRAMGAFRNENSLEKTLEFALSRQVRQQDAVYILIAVWSNPKGRNLAWELVKKRWEELRKRYGGGHFLLPRLLQTAGEFIDTTKAKDVENFFRKNPTPEAARTILQALEQIYSNAAWLVRDKKILREFMDDYHADSPSK